MKAMRVAEARARFGAMLDEAEKGDAVVIERRGVRFKVVVERPPKAVSRPGFEFVDADVLSGQWNWEQGRDGARFKGRRKAR